MHQKDLQQISSLLDQKLEKNNKILKKEIAQVENNIAQAANKAFNDFEEVVREVVKDELKEVKDELKEVKDELKEVKDELKKKPNEDKMFKWADEQITPVKLDVDKLKYIHRDVWQDLPNSGTVSRALVEKRIK